VRDREEGNERGKVVEAASRVSTGLIPMPSHGVRDWVRARRPGREAAV
jgi:hypothetical protein